MSQPTSVFSVPGSSGTRTLDFFPNGAVKSIADGPSNASFGYDAFGALQQLTVHTLNADRRADQYFGRYIKQRIEGSQSVINRRIPVPGAVATVHGPMTGNWTFAFGEPRGTRFVTDQTGAFVQEVSYQPFGEAGGKTGATPGTTNYENEQWNGGDLLAAFGVVNLGARVYDPVIGRFLSRDPILQASNPYVFAGNDPVNSSDPTGMLDNCGGSGGPFDPGPVTTCDETGGVIFTGSTQVPNNYGIGGLNEPPIELPGEIIDVTGTCGFACWPKNIFATMGRWGDPRFGNPQGVPAAAPVGPAIVPPAKKDPNHACVGNSICPAHWEGKTPPPGLGRYFGFGGEWFYHCDAHVFVETNCTSSGWDFDQSILHGECAYASEWNVRGESGGLDNRG